jgi:Spy/CpxP family protein refolding chaperone
MRFPMRTFVTASVLTAAALSSAIAQHHGHSQTRDHGAVHGAHGAYAGMHKREIKAFSPQQMDDLRSGKGMGSAMPAELNGYPGPLHVLELSSKLGLSDVQVAETKRLYAEMQEAAKAQGGKVIEAERELDSLFAQRKATAESLAALVSASAAAHGLLREIHLRYHLSMMHVLTPAQVATYNQLRGY